MTAPSLLKFVIVAVPPVTGDVKTLVLFPEGITRCVSEVQPVRKPPMLLKLSVPQPERFREVREEHSLNMPSMFSR